MTSKFNISNEDVSPGTIEYQDFELNLSESLVDQIDSLKEDLFHVSYPNGLLLDVGWYPSFDKDGAFHIKVIQNFDWDNPRFHAEASTINDLKICINDAILNCKTGG